MLKAFDFDLEPFIPIFSKLELDVAFLTPTETAYNKAIIDAIIPVRDFLKRNNLHDYEKQGQGPENKKKLPAFFVTDEELIETKASLYRPKTKKGDPRIWFSKLTRYCNAEDTLALVTDGKMIYVIDLSLKSISNSLLSKSYVFKILKELSEREKAISKELLSKIQEIHNKGFISTVTVGDTGVGMTLENQLGILPNPSKSPDYKGIEIKAKRSGFRYTNRVNLFSQVPDWDNSRGMTAEKLLNEYGYWGVDYKGNQRFQLYCTVTANRPNTQGLYFSVREEEDILENRSLVNKIDKYVLQWSFEKLRNNLQKKHRETFWVGAESKVISGVEHFQYNTVVHTKKPNISLFPYLVDSEVITMDYTMHRKPNGKVRDHGYLFKIRPEKINLLFPEPLEYNLKNKIQQSLDNF